MQDNRTNDALLREGEDCTFALFRPMIRATDGLTLRQVCAVTRLEPSTIQNWIKRGFVARPVNKKYRERQLARILLIADLRDCMKIENIGALLASVNGDTEDTSDDIISEEQLYDYLRAVIGRAGKGALSFDAIPAAVREVTADYIPTDDTAAIRLNEALTVMAFAYTAGLYKQEADRRFQMIQEDNYES